jgi:hypothetical protein
MQKEHFEIIKDNKEAIKSSVQNILDAHDELKDDYGFKITFLDKDDGDCNSVCHWVDDPITGQRKEVCG